MLLMMIERFRHGDARMVGERFSTKGRMLPDDVIYHASWVETTGDRCFQIVEAPTLASLSGWISVWDDLIDFEVAPVLTSTDFWGDGNLVKASGQSRPCQWYASATRSRSEPA